MAQILVPITDYSVSNLTNQAASSSNLYQSIDEGVSSNDSDYYENTSPTSGIAIHLITAGTDPTSSADHVIHVRGMITLGSGNIEMNLWQGVPGIAAPPPTGNRIATFTPTLTSSVADYSYTLSGTEADYITDYTALYIQISCTGTGKGGAGSARIHNFYFEVPNAAASGPTNLKTFDDLAKASIQTINGLTLASVKSVNGLT